MCCTYARNANNVTWKGIDQTISDTIPIFIGIVPCSLFLVPCSLFHYFWSSWGCFLFLVPCFLIPCSLFFLPLFLVSCSKLLVSFCRCSRYLVHSKLTENPIFRGPHKLYFSTFFESQKIPKRCDRAHFMPWNPSFVVTIIGVSGHDLCYSKKKIHNEYQDEFKQS